MTRLWQTAFYSVGAFVLAGAVTLWLWPVEVEIPDEPAAETPKLAVLIAFDQMRGDYLLRWHDLLGEGGVKRIESEGAWFTNCHYPYAYTLTAPGHASMSTGTSPYRHGIIANDWYDRAHAETVSATTPLPNDRRQGDGPHRRRVETVGDSLQRATKGKAKVVGLSIKARSAILLAALRAQLCYWFSSATGNFVTSPYYRDEPHAWVKSFNKQRPADGWLGQSWQRLRLEPDYLKYAGPDDFYAEGSGFEQGRVFPHPFKLGTGKTAREQYYNAVVTSPAGSELLLALAKTAIVEEKLGQRDTTDLLCISFSSNDAVGHCWGPDSQEVLDITLRSDALIRDLLAFLDANVGKGRYVLTVCADHGVCPLPEYAAKEGKDAGRVAPEILTSGAGAFLNRHFLKPGQSAPWLETPKKSNAWVYLNRATIKEQGLTDAEVETALAGWLAQQPGIGAAFTRTQLRGKDRLDDPLAEAMRKSFHPDRSGDVMVIPRPYHILSTPLNVAKSLSFRTTHGTPHPYDTHVPLLVFGPRVVPGRRADRVTPQAVASILAAAVGIPPPADADAPVPAGLFRE
jgi:hypothetical protein